MITPAKKWYPSLKNYYHCCTEPILIPQLPVGFGLYFQHIKPVFNGGTTLLSFLQKNAT
jgi:hypothetical protein